MALISMKTEASSRSQRNAVYWSPTNTHTVWQICHCCRSTNSPHQPPRMEPRRRSRPPLRAYRLSLPQNAWTSPPPQRLPPPSLLQIILSHRTQKRPDQRRNLRRQRKTVLPSKILGREINIFIQLRKQSSRSV